MSELERITAALAAEQGALDEVVSGLTVEQLSLATPSPGWSVIDQISHLAYFDGTAALSIEDTGAFRASEREMRSLEDLDIATLQRDQPDESRIAAWRTNRKRLAAAAAVLNDRDRVEWYGPSMGARSFITARLMECWAHGEDIRDTVGSPHSESERMKDIATLGLNTRRWSYVNRGMEVPVTPVRILLAAPSGEHWQLGDPDATDLISGPALDFCQVVTQRRNVSDTALAVTGAAAREWMEIAQAFAGAPTTRPASDEGDS